MAVPDLARAKQPKSQKLDGRLKNSMIETRKRYGHPGSSGSSTKQIRIDSLVFARSRKSETHGEHRDSKFFSQLHGMRSNVGCFAPSLHNTRKPHYKLSQFKYTKLTEQTSQQVINNNGISEAYIDNIPDCIGVVYWFSNHFLPVLCFASWM